MFSSQDFPIKQLPNFRRSGIFCLHVNFSWEACKPIHHFTAGEPAACLIGTPAVPNHVQPVPRWQAHKRKVWDVGKANSDAVKKAPGIN